MGWMLPFTRLFDRMESGVKRMTTRLNAAHWSARWVKAHEGGCKTLNIWRKNPRYSRDATILRRDVPWTDFRARPGSEFTEQDAIDDGFDSLEEYLTELGNIHGMTRQEVLEHVWGQIIWEPDEFRNASHQ